jgi:hypothetical protein
LQRLLPSRTASVTPSEQTLQKAMATAHALDAALRVLHQVSGVFPPLQAAVGGLIGCIDVFKVHLRGISSC